MNRIINDIKLRKVFILFPKFLAFCSTILLFIFYLFKDKNYEIKLKSSVILLVIICLLYCLTIFVFKKYKMSKKSLTISTILSIFFSVVLYYFSYDILNFFNIETGIINFTVFSLKILLIFIPILGFKAYTELALWKNIIKNPTANTKFQKLIYFSLCFTELILFFIFSFFLYKKLGFTGIIWAISVTNIIATIINFILGTKAVINKFCNY